ncbi:formylglycine-generating enzyme family protein [Methylobacterium isbiliense]|uniref:Hercynine oxygenase n=1 Tax=Methylobacterium isbiliense TaxID=315478 RepID=A0ABQ4SBA6_9HYPH|nr:formylglycine-generating enzyme family protein [Methylobacterium isbiliense]MDN3622064.1 formylglycine-generating enzyme family protein [Methylobacterium isbiliense]GJD99422.1 Hercynine oxygenase [Methylobacterium isbiliense]
MRGSPLGRAVALAWLSAAGPAWAGEPPAGPVALDRTEVTVAAFAAFADRTGLRTAAERDGYGHDYAGGWQRRPGWHVRAPYGVPAAPDEPAVHVTWAEARAYCEAAGGRLPTAEEWRAAAYTEARPTPTDGFARGRTYPYPVGDTPEGLHIAEAGARRHAPVGSGRPGVNGLHHMGGNVWEWLADRRGGEALTAGGSWWYGAAQTRRDGLQWKEAAFHAVYIGFRCAHP